MKLRTVQYRGLPRVQGGRKPGESMPWVERPKDYEVEVGSEEGRAQVQNDGKEE
jgi:hypothetical protein